jgi:hypothetical protein
MQGERGAYRAGWGFLHLECNLLLCTDAEPGVKNGLESTERR